ncbi:hypothetical protein ACLIYN_28565, partial [Streptomyces atacamensis]
MTNDRPDDADPIPEHLRGKLAQLGITLDGEQVPPQQGAPVPGPTATAEDDDGEDEAPYGYWPEPCANCGKLIPRAKPAGAGRPPEYCNKECQNEKKAARARERNAPGLPGQIIRVEETVTRLEQVTADMRLELQKINSPEGIEARLAAARAANANDVAQANQKAVQAQADAAAARSEAQQAHADREAAEAAAERDRTAREAAEDAKEVAEQEARAAERKQKQAEARAEEAIRAQQLAEQERAAAVQRADEARQLADAAAAERDAATAARDEAHREAAAAQA